MTYGSTVTATSVVTTQPTSAITTQIFSSASLATQTVPFSNVTVTITPTISATIVDTEVDSTTSTVLSVQEKSAEFAGRLRKLRARKPTEITWPGPLQGYAPSIVSSACSENAVMPTPGPNVTSKFVSTITQISYDAIPYAIYNSTVITPASTTISYGNYSFTKTATPVIFNISQTTTATTTVDVTSTTIVETCSPTIILASPTAIYGNANGDSSVTYDDDDTYVILQDQELRMFDHSSSNISVSTNGVLSLFLFC